MLNCGCGKLLTGASSLALVFGAGFCAKPALAQTTDSNQSTAADINEVPDIVVTAERRSQSTLNIPTTISVVSGAAVEAMGISRVDQLGQVTPSVNMTRTGPSLQPYIRGIGNRSTSPGDESETAIYIDGVYQASQITIVPLDNLERIEVLKGPQGTLSGRNAAAGAINFITADPSLTEFSGNVMLSYGSYNALRGSGRINGPISSTLGVDLAVSASRDDGYYRDILTGRRVGGGDANSVRAKLLWKPAENFRVLLAGHFAYENDPGTLELQPINGNSAARAVNPAVIVATKPLDIALSFQPVNSYRQRGVSATLTWNLPQFDVVSISSYTYVAARFRNDSDATPQNRQESLGNLQDTGTYTSELRFVSPTDQKFEWIAGLYGFKNKGRYHTLQNIVNGAVSQTIDTVATSSSFAAFAQLKYGFTDRFSVTGGLRYTYERRGYVGYFNNVLGANATKTYNIFTPRLSLQYKLADQTQLYATIARGFKSGVFNAAAASNVAARPEILTSYEVGLKSLIVPWLRTELSAFYYDYKDIQVTARNGLLGTTILQNAGGAELYGIELATSATPIKNLSIDFNAAYLHTRYTDFVGAAVTIPLFNASGLPIGNSQVFQSATGLALVKAPSWTGTLGATYKQPMSWGDIRLNASAGYTGKFNWELLGRVTEPAHTLVSARLTAELNSGFSLSLWGTNLTDERYSTYEATSATGDVRSFGRPREFGISVGYKF